MMMIYIMNSAVMPAGNFGTYRYSHPGPADIRAAREYAGLSARQAAELVGVTTLTWQRWEGQTSRKTKMPAACWELFLIKTRIKKSS